eukprot:CAMPEP_0168340392 /NCGR_PEP_ID=MMETSP0213-20121227/14037_1 /TAXON_ID=151035 /ORGANISM="Euplotes harpa, Strain FSP1.4" /LENGTH=200 /DNA_ID=CAMNT_0008346621 /DNA_START=321 /DNA_END=923 /DNA_ORIENTATION=-
MVIEYGTTRRFEIPKLALLLKNPIVGIYDIHNDPPKAYFFRAEELTISMVNLKYYTESKIIDVLGLKEMVLKGLHSVDVHDETMLKLMTDRAAQVTDLNNVSIITVKVDPASTIARMDSGSLLNTYQSDKKNGFTLETTTSSEGIKANLIIGSFKVDMEVMKQTLEEFDRLYAYFSVFITFKPKLKYDEAKEFLDIIFNL